MNFLWLQMYNYVLEHAPLRGHSTLQAGSWASPGPRAGAKCARKGAFTSVKSRGNAMGTLESTSAVNSVAESATLLPVADSS